MADDSESLTADHGFPMASLVPKCHTGSEAFLQKYPTWDGRGIIIGILDTGVDPDACGLQKTSIGELKILDLVDTTGSGDVDTSCIRTTLSERNREIKSLHGHILRIPDKWCNPTGEWHVGVKSEYDFLPSAVKSRAQEEFLREVWEPNHSAMLAEAIRALEQFNLQHLDLKLPLELMLEKENLEAKIDILEKLSNKVLLPGAVFDCIVFHDGQSWSAVLNVCREGNLECNEVLKPFKETGQTMKIGDVTLSVNVYDDGNTLSLVTAGGAHGTHVASIAAAYIPDCQELSGVAPGAQIISIKIGDNRLGTMETATSLIRACSVAVSSGVNIINFSYGETSHWTNKGAVLEVMSEVCQKNGVVFVASAGNNGPALSTVGCPGGNTSGLIGVGAFVSAEMMSAEYSMTRTKPSVPYTWSSRGPASDGDLGVCITAPGGAVASVPNWTLRKNQLMNGTSMSSPNACGCIALLLSALRSSNVSYNPAFIKRIIENTAVPLGNHDPFTVGHGVIRVDKAYDAALRGLPSGLVDLQVSISGDNGRGIYLREPHQIGKLFTASVNIEPKFSSEAGTQQKIDFQLYLTLFSTDCWVTSPKYLALWNGVRQFKVEVDPRNLESGVHYAEVMAYLSGDERGPIFRIPITVVIPEVLTDKDKGVFHVPELVLVKNHVKRFFFHVPKEVTWADLELLAIKCECQSRIAVHSVEILPERSFRENENNEVVTVEPDGCAQLILRVLGGHTMELCLAPYWSELWDITLDLKMTFHSILPSTSSLIFNGPNMWTSIQVMCAFREEEIFPEFKLTHSITYKRPFSDKISPLGMRDMQPNGTRPFQLVLSYRIHVSRATEVWPEFPLLSDLLYENPYSGQLWMMFTAKKEYVCAGDAYSRHYTSKLDKGDYILKLQVRHAKQAELKKLTEMPLCVHSKLSSPLTLEVATTRYGLFSGQKVTHKVLYPGVGATLYLRALPDEKLSKCDVHYGDVLSGQFTFSKRERIKRKLGYNFEYIVGPDINRPIPSSATEKNPTQKLYTDALRDLRIDRMKSGLMSIEELQEEYSEDIHFLLAKLRRLSESDDSSYESVEAVVSKVLSKVNITDILADMGLRNRSFDDGQESYKDKRRQIVECLVLEGTILLQIQPSSDRLKHIYMDLHKLLDKKDAKLRAFTLHYAEKCGHFATTIRLIEEEINENGGNRFFDEKLLHCYRELGWKDYATLQAGWLLRKYPLNYLGF